MALVRVFLVTYRRPLLLRRALASLLAQTFRDWVCEVHNDAPGDLEPARILQELSDPRIELNDHVFNWGAVVTFNHAFAGASEPFASLLEDDNWWEPDFLARMLRILSENPRVNLAWANMRVWKEESGGGWRDTGETIWPVDRGADCELTDFPILLQAFDALHSNGAMLFRREIGGVTIVPVQTPFGVIEAVRERAIPGPMAMVREPLANFALTQRTARSGDLLEWLDGQLLLAASFFGRIRVTPAAIRKIWCARRESTPRSTNILLILALVGVRTREFIHFAEWKDWWHLSLAVLRRPLLHLRSIGFRRRNRSLWEFLVAETDRRIAAREEAGLAALDDSSPVTKSEVGLTP